MNGVQASQTSGFSSWPSGRERTLRFPGGKLADFPSFLASFSSFFENVSLSLLPVTVVVRAAGVTNVAVTVGRGVTTEGARVARVAGVAGVVGAATSVRSILNLGN